MYIPTESVNRVARKKAVKYKEEWQTRNATVHSYFICNFFCGYGDEENLIQGWKLENEQETQYFGFWNVLTSKIIFEIYIFQGKNSRDAFLLLVVVVVVC